MASQCGTPALARALNRILVEHIRSVLPSLRTRLEDALGKRVAELQLYGAAPPGSTSAQRCGHDLGAKVLAIALEPTQMVSYSAFCRGCFCLALRAASSL